MTATIAPRSAPRTVPGSGQAAVTTVPAPRERGDDLLGLLAAGDARAWDEVVARYERLVRSRIRGFRLQPADVEDALAATWLRLAQHASRIEHADRLASWLCTVAGRECLRLLDRSAAAGIPAEDVGMDVPEQTANPEERALSAALAREVRALVAALPGRRQVLIAALFGEDAWTYDRITADIGIPTGSIGPTRARALAELRTLACRRGLTA